MLKPGLGKSLGDLMRGDQVARKRPSTPGNAAPILGRGMQTLVQPDSAEGEPEQTRPLLPSWFYFAADLLLLAYAVAITFEAPKPFDFGTVLFCGASIGLGALLGIIGLVQATQRS